MPYVTNEGIRIHYQIDGNGPPLVLQHGFTQKARSWELAGYVDALKPRYRLIRVDARGHGDSDKPYDPGAYTLSAHANDVVAVLDVLDLRTAHFWGYSMGGWIGFGMAKYAPQRLAALVIGGAQPYGRTLRASRPDGSDPQAFLQDLFGRLGVNPFDALPPDRRAELMANDFRALAGAQQDRPSLAGVLPTMKMPCCLYVGEADGILQQVATCSKEIPNATFMSFSELNHADAFYRSDVVLPPILAFLGAHTQRDVAATSSGRGPHE
jgi:pimeloyl-ACP methyl ester carboxylesterase